MDGNIVEGGIRSRGCHVLVPDESPLSSHENLEYGSHGHTKVVVAFSDTVCIIIAEITIAVNFDLTGKEAHTDESKNVENEDEESEERQEHRNSSELRIHENFEVSDFKKLEDSETSKCSQDQKLLASIHALDVTQVDSLDSSHHDESVEDIKVVFQERSHP